MVFYLFTASLTWIGKFTVLGLFDSYAYKTGLFADPWAQNLLGHLLINTTLYPSAAIVMVANSLYYGWILSVAVVTSLSIFHKWFTKMNQKRYRSTRAITFYFVAMIVIHIPAPVLLLLGKQYYQISLINNLFGNLYLSSIIIIFFYHLIESFLLVLCTCILKKWY